jgi:hypothetical protein
VTDRQRLVRKWLLLSDRWEERRQHRGKPVRAPWGYLNGIGKAMDVVRARIDQLDRQRLAA